MGGDDSRMLAAGLSVMREVNRSLVLDLVKGLGPLSRAGIAKAATLAKPTVSVIVDELVHAGLVREIGAGQPGSRGGRRPILLEFNARSQFVAGVHLGVQRTNVVLADAAGAEVGRTWRRTSRGRPEAALRTTAGLIEEVVKASLAGRERLAAVGVCVPGLVRVADGHCLLAPNLGWRDVPVRELLAAELGVPVFVHNTAQAAAVAEAVEGAARGSSQVVLLYAGTGVGAGILSEGRILHGQDGIAGEIGHVPWPGASEPCSCGRVGCLETVASAAAIARAAYRRANGRLPSGKTTSMDVAAAAEAGDTAALQVLGEAGRVLGTAAGWLINVLNPEVLVLGGGVTGAGRALLEPLREAVFATALPLSAERVQIRTWALGQEAKVRGAVLLALQHSKSYYRVVFQG